MTGWLRAGKRGGGGPLKPPTVIDQMATVDFPPPATLYPLYASDSLDPLHETITTAVLTCKAADRHRHRDRKIKRTL